MVCVILIPAESGHSASLQLVLRLHVASDGDGESSASKIQEVLPSAAVLV